MNSALLRIIATPIWDETYPEPGNWLPQHEGYVLIPDDSLLTYPPIAAANPVVIGRWDNATGEPVGIVDEMEYITLRPLGNSDGIATLPLLPPYGQGAAQPLMNNSKLYPDGYEPFDVEIRHSEKPGGWTWRAEMRGSYTERDPGVYAIAWYSDAECTQYIGTTGAFTQQASEWQVDGNGDPLTVWATNGWDGDLRPSSADWNLALLYASLQHGHATLSALQSGIRFLFWDSDQGSGGSWVDSGSTWVSLVGANTMQISDTSPFSIGSHIKIQETEMTVASIFTPGSPGIITVDLALPQFNVGDPIFILA